MARKKAESSARQRRRPFAGEKATDTKASRQDAKPTTTRAKTQSGRSASTKKRVATSPKARNATTDKTSGDYEVGYKKPPTETRFKPGQSGNSKGRRRGTRNFKTILEEILAAPIPVSYGGKRKTMRVIDAIGTQLARKSAGGDSRATRLIFDAIDRHDLFAEPEDDVRDPNGSLSANDLLAIEEIRSRMLDDSNDHETDDSETDADPDEENTGVDDRCDIPLNRRSGIP